MAPNFSVSIGDHGDRYELQLGYQRRISYKKRIPRVTSSVSYIVDDDKNPPLSGQLIVSTFNTVEPLALANPLASCETWNSPLVNQCVFPIPKKW